NSRRLAERLTSHLNELHAERQEAAAAAEAGPGGDDPDGDGAGPGDQDVDAVPAGPPRQTRPPAQVMAQSGASSGHDGTFSPVVARAHHGSVSKEQRADIEAALKSGLLPCVVATSSLELGIDMGAVDVVVQV